MVILINYMAIVDRLKNIKQAIKEERLKESYVGQFDFLNNEDLSEHEKEIKSEHCLTLDQFDFLLEEELNLIGKRFSPQLLENRNIERVVVFYSSPHDILKEYYEQNIKRILNHSKIETLSVGDTLEDFKTINWDLLITNKYGEAVKLFGLLKEQKYSTDKKEIEIVVLDESEQTNNIIKGLNLFTTINNINFSVKKRD